MAGKRPAYPANEATFEAYKGVTEAPRAIGDFCVGVEDALKAGNTRE